MTVICTSPCFKIQEREEEGEAGVSLVTACAAGRGLVKPLGKLAAGMQAAASPTP